MFIGLVRRKINIVLKYVVICMHPLKNVFFWQSSCLVFTRCAPNNRHFLLHQNDWLFRQASGESATCEMTKPLSHQNNFFQECELVCVNLMVYNARLIPRMRSALVTLQSTSGNIPSGSQWVRQKGGKGE